MDQIILFALLGLGTGALIAGIGLGIVLSYRGSGVINLATGAVAMVAGYLFFGLRTELLGVTLGTMPALVVALVLTVALGVLVELVVFRPLRTSAPLSKLVASLGVLLIAQAAITLIDGGSGRIVPSVLPNDVAVVFGARIPADRFWLTGIVVLAAALLWALYRWSRFGLATRAASESEASAVIAGLSPDRLALTNTVLATTVAGGMGILAASLTQIDTVIVPLQVVPALGAALFARFTSFSITCVAGLLIGVVQSLLYYAQTKPWFPTDQGLAMPGVNGLLTFLVIVVALWWRGSALPVRGELVEARLPRAPRPRRIGRTAAIGLAAGIVLVFVIPFGYRNALAVSLAGTAICLSFVVITGFVGQVSVVQVALAGVAGFALSHLAVDAGLGFPVAAVCAVAVATALGFAAGASALRVRGVSLAVVTLAAAVAIEQFGFSNSTWGAGGGASPVPEPTLLGVDIGAGAAVRALDGGLPSPVLGVLVLAVVVATCLLVARIRQSGLGQRMLAVRSNERAAAAAGVSVRATKFAAYALSSCIAGIGGVLYAYALGSVSIDRFGILIALEFVAFAYVGGISMVSGAVLAGLMTAQGVIPHVLDTELGLDSTWTLLFAGVLLVACLVLFPNGIAGTWHARRSRRAARARSAQQLARAYVAGGQA
jgi:branched-chain amino acid transport system permease protein